MHRLRVVRLVPGLDFGGVESRVVLQAQHHDRRALDFEVLAFHRLGAAARAIRDAGVTVRELAVNPSVRNCLTTMRLASWLRAARPDVVHASVAEANFHLLAAARLVRPPVLIAEEVGVPTHGRTAKAVFRRLYRQADAVIGVSRTTCDYLERRDGAPANRIRLVYNCAGSEHFSEPPTPIRHRHAAAPFRILLVGRCVPVKNQQVVLEAFATFSRSCPSAELLIAGDGPLRGQLESRARELDVVNRVRILGFRRDIRQLLQSTDLFVLPSLSEGCSVSLIEAMASGTMVLVSRVGGNLEVIGRHADQWAVAPGDVAGWVAAFRRVYDLSHSEYEQFARSAQQMAYGRFSPTAYVRVLENLYAGLATAARETPRNGDWTADGSL